MRKKLRNSFLLALFVTSIIGSMHFFGILASWDTKLQNFLYPYNTNAHTSLVKIIAIDEKSLASQAKGGLGRWQNWPRTYLGEVIKKAHEAGAVVIGVDILLSEPSNEQLKELWAKDTFPKDLDSKLKADDTFLQNTLENTPHTVLAAKNEGEMLLPLDVFQTKNTTLGSVDMQLDSDGALRTIQLRHTSEKVPNAFSLEIVRQYFASFGKIYEPTITENILNILPEKIKNIHTGKTFGPLSLPLEATNSFRTAFFGSPNTIPHISFVDVYNGTVPQQFFKDSIILIGEMNGGLHDEMMTPVSFGTPMPGVEIHANSIESLLFGKNIQQLPLISTLILIFFCSFFASLISFYTRPLLGSVVLTGILIIYGACALLLFSYGILLPIFYIILTLINVFTLSVLYKYFSEEKTKIQISGAFSRYVSPKVVEEIIKAPEKLSLGGAKKNLSVSFTDIAGFTTISEKQSPEEVVALLHRYLEKMTTIILEQEGTLDKYIGDAIMAFWGAPISQEDHALRACQSALSIHKTMGELRTTEEFKNLHIRTGIASGPMVVGNIGSLKRFDYTVIGDKVNLASRLEGVNKIYDTEICVSEDTMLLAKDHFYFRQLDRIRVKGKNDPITIYELICSQETVTSTIQDEINHFHHMLELYQERKFDEAYTMLQAYTYTHISPSPKRVYLERIEHFMKNPPVENWDGVFDMTSK